MSLDLREDDAVFFSTDDFAVSATVAGEPRAVIWCENHVDLFDDPRSPDMALGVGGNQSGILLPADVAETLEQGDPVVIPAVPALGVPGGSYTVARPLPAGPGQSLVLLHEA